MEVSIIRTLMEKILYFVFDDLNFSRCSFLKRKSQVAMLGFYLTSCRKTAAKTMILQTFFILQRTFR